MDANAIFWAVATASHSSRESARGSELVGNKYCVHEVLCPEVAGLNLEVPKSKLENQVQIQEAKYGGEPEVVLIASR